MVKYILGFNIGGSKCSVVLASVGQNIDIVSRTSFDTLTANGFDDTWRRLLAVADSLLTEASLAPSEYAPSVAAAPTAVVATNAAPKRVPSTTAAPSATEPYTDAPSVATPYTAMPSAAEPTAAARLTAVGVSCGGPLDSEAGVILNPPNLPGWINIPIIQILEEKYGVPAFLMNDANACALVEWMLGAGRGCRDMLFITMGTGFGCGVIANGELLTGANGMCGEAGHIRLANEGPFGYGKEGSVEGFCSGGGIAHLMRMETRRLISEGVTPGWVRDGVPFDQFSAKTLKEYAEKGDPEAEFIWNKVGEYLGRALAILIDAFNPERIVIGSIFARCENLLRPAMEKVIEKEALDLSWKACNVVPAATGERIGDLASIMSACYALGLTPVSHKLSDSAKSHFNSLFYRYPSLDSARKSVMEAFDIMSDCFARGGKLLICGNGGSAADAEHIVGELMKGFNLKRQLSPKMKRAIGRALGERGLCLQQALPAIALTRDASLSTAFSNDVDPEYVFAQQVLGYGRRGDALLALSTSGRSKNVVAAARLAGALGLRVIALTGSGAGMLGDCCDVLIACPGGNTAEIQEMHTPVYHTLCAMLEETFFGANTPDIP